MLEAAPDLASWCSFSIKKIRSLLTENYPTLIFMRIYYTALLTVVLSSLFVRITAIGWMLVFYGFATTIIPTLIHIVLHLALYRRSNEIVPTGIWLLIFSHISYFLFLLLQVDFSDTPGAYNGLSQIATFLQIPVSENWKDHLSDQFIQILLSTGSVWLIGEGLLFAFYKKWIG